MTDICTSQVCTTRGSAIVAWVRAMLVRPGRSRQRRLARIELESWSHHLLKDIGLADEYQDSR
ncbi:MAG: hypothetical protein ACREEE_17045 [Dongiaceae bacterium]